MTQRRCSCPCCSALDVVEAELRALLEKIERIKPPTDARFERLAELERQLAGEEAGARAAAIRQRMGLSKTHYYRLRAQWLQSHESHLSDGTRD